MPPELFWFLIVALVALALGSMLEQRRNDREVCQELFDLKARVRKLEAERFILPPAPEARPPAFPLPPEPKLPLQSKLTRVWRRG